MPTNNQIASQQEGFSATAATAEEPNLLRLQKFLARGGVASRRASEKLIVEGHVTINDQVATELGTKVDPARDEVRVDGTLITLETASVTLMLNKPAGYVTTMKDPQGRPCVASLIPLDEYPSLYPVGRLDRDTTGLLLFSTDGALGDMLLHPRHHVQKTYLALTLGEPSEQKLEQLRQGIELSDGMTQPAEVHLLQGEERERALQELSLGEAGASGTGNAARKLVRGKQAKKERRGVVCIAIREGRNRQVRRMLEAVGCPVIALHRESFGDLNLEQLPRGSWRLLTEVECQQLRNAVS